MRHVVYSAWRVFCSCLVIGVWRCLFQDMDFERHATLLFCAKSANVETIGAERKVNGYDKLLWVRHGNVCK